jgi:DNA-binding PadR family transcriptional regulator
VGISLAAWLDKFFLDLEQEGLVILQRKAGGGLPSATIDVTEKGRKLFEEAKQAAAL